MSLEGTIVNGVIRLDGDPPLPEGARVWVEIEDELDNLPVPPPTETYAEYLASLRQSIAETKAGDLGMTLEEFAAELERDFGRPPVPGG